MRIKYSAFVLVTTLAICLLPGSAQAQTPQIVPKRTQLELGSSKQQQPYAQVEGYRADELVIAVAPVRAPANALAARKGRSPLPDANDVLRAAQSLMVRSKSTWFKTTYVEGELRKRSEFKALGLTLVTDKQKADIYVVLDRPLFTYTYTFELIDAESSIVLSGGRVAEKDRSSHGSNAAPMIA